uniref:DUF5018 domain-containing protein n=1 Tax=Treponema primitia TaxID=88058 RepID=UPI000255545A
DTDDASGIITLTVPHGTDLTSIVPEFSHTGVSVDVASGVARDFSGGPLTYTVTAADGSARTYTVTVTMVAVDAKALTAFNLTSPVSAAGTVNEAAKTVTIIVPYGTTLTGMIAQVTHDGVLINPDPTIARSYASPVPFTVSAADGSTQVYTVTVTVAAANAKAITTFTLAGATGIIDDAGGTITVTVPHGTDLTSIAPVFSHTGASVDVASGVARDFSGGPLSYTVTAADGSIRTYTVNVNITSDTVINVLSLNGLVTAPVKDTAPDTTGIDESQYTGTVTWQKGDGASFAGNFARATVYQAIVTLTAKPGYTLTGMTANSFTYGGAAVTNAADSGILTITFPATGVDLILLGSYPGTPTVTVEGDLIKSITTTAGEILIGRKVNETLTLKIDSSGVIQFRDAVDGSIPIGSYAEFQLINTDYHTLGGAYKQDADIDLLGIAPGSPSGAWSGQEWTPVGTGSDDVVFFNPFIGTFDGDGKSISNLYINSPTVDYQGLFGALGMPFEALGEVKNVHIRSGSISGNDYIGGIAGWLNALISDCSNNSSVSGGVFVGGVVGYIDASSTIRASSNSGSVTGASFVGGMAGWTIGYLTVGSNSGSATGTGVLGGIAGYNGGMIYISSNSGAVIGTGDRVGGVAGDNYGDILGSYNIGPVSGSSLVGGVAGHNSYAHITASYNIGSVSGSSSVGGVAGENDEATITACYWATYIGDGVGAIGSSGTSGGSGTGNGGTTQFSGVDWPDESIVTGTGTDFRANAWGVGTGTGIGALWKSLGGWNGGSPQYPKLYWE